MNPPITIIREPQLSGSVAEPLILSISADLARRGMLRVQSHAWDDHVTFARTQDGTVAAAICWRVSKWTRDAYVSLGGVSPDHRRQGIYRALFEDVVADVRDNHPGADRIASGHHIANAESAAMHRALGRKMETLGYTFPIMRAASAETSRPPLSPPPPPPSRG